MKYILSILAVVTAINMTGCVVVEPYDVPRYNYHRPYYDQHREFRPQRLEYYQHRVMNPPPYYYYNNGEVYVPSRRFCR